MVRYVLWQKNVYLLPQEGGRTVSTMQENNPEQLTYEFTGFDSDARLREMILYIADRCMDDPTFGAVKLNKILYNADFLSYQEYGQSVTGAAYMRLPQGPVPQRLLHVRITMEEAREIAIRKHLVPLPGDKGFGEQQRVIALRDPDLDHFKPRDIAVVDEVIRLLWGRSAKQVSDASHGRAWRICRDKERIPYEAVFISDEPLTEYDICRTYELAQQHGWHQPEVP
jgi:hypothetical protein